MAGDRQSINGVPSVLGSTGDLMEWWVFPPAPEEDVPTFSFEFVRDDGSGRLDHVHVEPGDVDRLIRFLGGVSVSDLQREYEAFRNEVDQSLAPHEVIDAGLAALDGLAVRLGLDGGGD